MEKKQGVKLSLRAAAEKYMLQGYGATGDWKAAICYREAIRHLKKEAKLRKHSFCGTFRRRDLAQHLVYMDRASKERTKAVSLMKRAIDNGHDLAVMHDAFYYMDHAEVYFKIDRGMTEEVRRELAAEVIARIERAYELGFAPAAYMLSIIYRDGYHDIEADAEKAEHYYARFEALCRASKRQRALSARLPVTKKDEPGTHQLDYYSFIQWLL